MKESMLFGRHDRVYLSPDAPASALKAEDAQTRESCFKWARSGLPFVARRAENALNGGVALAVRFPGTSKPGVALAAGAAAVAQRLPPLPLREAVEAAPVAHRQLLRDLDAKASGNGVILRVYGSLFWQATAGAAYMTAQSDIDLVFSPDTAAQLDAMLAILVEAARYSPVRLDGEVMFPGRRGASWRELAAGRGQTLVKTPHFVFLAPVEELRRSLGEAA